MDGGSASGSGSRGVSASTKMDHLHKRHLETMIQRRGTIFADPEPCSQARRHAGFSNKHSDVSRSVRRSDEFTVNMGNCVICFVERDSLHVRNRFVVSGSRCRIQQFCSLK